MNGQNGSEKNITVKIAKELGYSQATVSRVIRHCGGVDSETRRHILSTAGTKADGVDCRCDMYVILPDTPRYFWEELKKGVVSVKTAPDLVVKHNIYTNVRDEDVILFYLDEAGRMKARVILLVAVMTPAILERLRALQKDSTIFLLSEWGDLPNSFFFGADSYKDGFTMGEIFCRDYSTRIPFVVNVENNYNVERRTAGFADALRQYDGERFRNIPMCSIPHRVASDIRLFPSKIASLLTEVMDAESSYCLYIPFGNLYMSRVIQKIKGRDRVLCLGQDCMLGEDGHPETGIAVTIKQNTFLQGQKAVEAAVRYVTQGLFPEKKCTLIPSGIRE